MRVPWLGASAGARTSVRAELVDLYRTIVDLAGLDSSTVQADVQGTSLAALFADPAAPPPALATKAAFSQIGSCACQVYTKGAWSGLECNVGRCFETPTNSSNWDFMGYSIMDADGWRFTLWVPWNATLQRADFSKVTHHELYDQTSDPVSPGLDFDFDGCEKGVRPGVSDSSPRKEGGRLRVAARECFALISPL